MSKNVLLTGGGTGLGQAITKQLADKGFTVYIVGRRIQKLYETQSYNPDRIIPIMADVSNPMGRKLILKKLKTIKLDYLVHNAGIIVPIEPLEKLTLKSFRKTISTNTEGPLFLTQLLLNQLNPNARILHISSDCAHYPLAHWIPYCTSKAALLMIYACLKKELLGKNIYIGSIDPGMMDTPMQQYICQDDITFPEKYSLEELQKDNLLLSPEFSAGICLKLLLDFSPEDFSQKEFCAYDFVPKNDSTDS